MNSLLKLLIGFINNFSDPNKKCWLIVVVDLNSVISLIFISNPFICLALLGCKEIILVAFVSIVVYIEVYVVVIGILRSIGAEG